VVVADLLQVPIRDDAARRPIGHEETELPFLGRLSLAVLRCFCLAHALPRLLPDTL
jgi:hypothetical protein